MGLAQLHNAADAGAHAGALVLDGTEDGLLIAVERAHQLATANKVHNEFVALSTDFTADSSGHPNNPDILVGRFDSPGENGCAEDYGCWTAIGAVPSETNSYDPEAEDRDKAVTAETCNAVHVQAQGSVPTLFGNLAFGTTRLAVANFATARRPLEKGVKCAFPVVLPMCTIQQMGGGLPCNRLIRLQLSSSIEDNAALATPIDSTGASTMRELLAHDDTTCAHRQSEDELTDTEDDMNLNNGALTSVTSLLADQVAGHSPVRVNTGDGVEFFDYSDNIQEWNPNWGPCPATVAEACDVDQQGICKGGGTDPAAYVSASACAAASGTWETTCPDTAPSCTAPSGFVRRQIAVFDSAAHGMPCDGTNGNPLTSGSFNWNVPVDTAAYTTLIIYAVQATSSEHFIDAYITCTNPDGLPYDDLDLDGVPDALHDGEEIFVELPEVGVAFVE